MKRVLRGLTIRAAPRTHKPTQSRKSQHGTALLELLTAHAHYRKRFEKGCSEVNIEILIFDAFHRLIWPMDYKKVRRTSDWGEVFQLMAERVLHQEYRPFNLRDADEFYRRVAEINRVLAERLNEGEYATLFPEE